MQLFDRRLCAVSSSGLLVRRRDGPVILPAACFFPGSSAEGPQQGPHCYFVCVCGWSESKKDVVRALNLNSYA